MRNLERSAWGSRSRGAWSCSPTSYPRFKSRFPHVELELHEQGSATMEESVLEGSVGIALLTTFPKYDELVYDLIQKENMVLLVNKACALAERIRPGTPIDIREAADEVFICSRQGHSARTILDALCAARNMKPEIGLETISIEVGKIRGGHQSRGHGLS